MFWLSSSCWALWRWTGGMKTPNLRIKEKSILWFVSFWDPIMYVGRKCAEMPFSADLAYFTSVCCLIVRGWPTVIRWFTLLTKCNRSVRCFFSFSSYILLLAHRKQRLYHKCLMRDTSGLHTYIQNGVHGRCKWWGASTCSALSIDFYGVTKYGLETVLYCIWHIIWYRRLSIRHRMGGRLPLWTCHKGILTWVGSAAGFPQQVHSLKSTYKKPWILVWEFCTQILYCGPTAETQQRIWPVWACPKWRRWEYHFKSFVWQSSFWL